MHEAQRLRFLVARDGPDAARDWARTTMRTYRRVVLEKGGQRSHGLYRAALVESYCAFRRFVVGLARGAPVAATLDDVAVWEADRTGRRSE
jgi:hypothetical protein